MRKKATVLVVDDNVEFTRNIQDILELKGFEVKTSSDGFRGIEIVRQGGIDLVLMDIKMPVMNGVEAFKKMKNLKPDMPVIMITAFAVEKLISEALQNGAFGCLRKPLDFDKLIGLIDDTFHDGAMILVIDDNEDICENIKDILSNKGYKVKVAYDGNIALNLVGENDFDVILLDMKLPPINGLETYLQIKKLRPDITVIIISGHLNEMNEIVNNTIRENAYTCIEKPINFDKLIAVLEKIEQQKSEGKIIKPGKDTIS